MLRGGIQDKRLISWLCRERGNEGVPYYYFEAATADGKIRRKVLKARDKSAADHRIREWGLHPILIESAHVAKKKRLKTLHVRHIVRDTLLAVTGISLVGGVAAYFIILDFASPDKLDVQKLVHSGIVSEASGVIHAKTPEERAFAREVRGVLDSSFPEAFGGITIERKFLMLVYVKERGKLTDADLEHIASVVTGAFQRRFDSRSCTLLLVHGKDKQTIAEGRCRRGETADVLIY